MDIHSHTRFHKVFGKLRGLRSYTCHVIQDESVDIRVFQNHTLVGYIMGRPRIGLVSLAIDPSFRRKGVAFSLLQLYQSWLQHHTDLQVLTLTCESHNAAAIALYAKCGFQISKQNQEDHMLGDTICTLPIERL
jgi:RimJ/RimL family protein N-acetyltransferase